MVDRFASNRISGSSHLTHLAVPHLAVSDRIFPGQASYRANRAAALIGLERYEEAAADCVRAIILDTGYTRAHQRLGALCARPGGLDAAFAASVELAKAEARHGDSMGTSPPLPKQQILFPAVHRRQCTNRGCVDRAFVTMPSGLLLFVSSSTLSA